MNKKLMTLLTGALMLCCYFGILFTMSSKDKVDPNGGGSINCNADSITRQITINFGDPNSANQWRKPNFQGHVPSNDLRFGTPPALLMSEKDKWYCNVTITSPQCPDFLFQHVLVNANNVINIHLPGDADFHVAVRYYETFDAPNNIFDFNISDTVTLFCIGETTRVNWGAYEYFQSAWNSGISQPLTLFPRGHKCDEDPFAVNKGLLPIDYETANDFIEDLYPNN